MNVNAISYTMQKPTPSFGNLIEFAVLCKALEKLEEDSYSFSSYSSYEPEIKYERITMGEFEKQGGKISNDGKKATVKNNSILRKKYTGIINCSDEQKSFELTRKFKDGKLIAQRESKIGKTTISYYDDKGELRRTFMEVYPSGNTDNSDPIYISETIDEDGNKSTTTYLPEHLNYDGRDVLKYFSYYQNGNIQYGPLWQENLQKEFIM